MAVIETHELTKRYGTTRAVASLTLSVSAGEIYGFLGPNGAGKSTTIALLLDHVAPTGGSARVLGFDTRSEQLAVRRRVGVLPQEATLDPRLTARRQLAFVLAAHGAPGPPDPLLDRVGLAGAGDRPVGEFSTGMRQRLRLGMALVDDPPVLVLDEPVTGLDPGGQRWLRRVLRRERDRGTTVFLSSHRLEQVEALADRVGILVDGRLQAVGSPADLGDELPPIVRAHLPRWQDDWGRALRQTAQVTSVRHEREGRHHRVQIALADRDAADRVRDALPDSATIEWVDADGGDLERAYAHLTGTGGQCDS